MASEGRMWKLDSGRETFEICLIVFSRSPSSALFPFLGECSPTKIDYRQKGTLILTSLLKDLVLHVKV